MTLDELQEENKMLRKILIQKERDMNELLAENKEYSKYREWYWKHRAEMDKGE